MISGTTESSWTLAEATEKRVMTPGQQTLACIRSEAVEGLLEEGVLAEGCLAAKALAPVGAGEEARRKRHRVDKRERGVVRSEEEQLLPEALLDL